MKDLGKGTRIFGAFILNFLFLGLGFILSGAIHWRRLGGRILLGLGAVLTIIGLYTSILTLSNLRMSSSASLLANLVLSSVIGLIAGLLGALAENELSGRSLAVEFRQESQKPDRSYTKVYLSPSPPPPPQPTTAKKQAPVTKQSTRPQLPRGTFFCRYCGAENHLDAIFCESCGKQIG